MYTVCCNKSSFRLVSHFTEFNGMTAWEVEGGGVNWPQWTLTHGCQHVPGFTQRDVALSLPVERFEGLHELLERSRVPLFHHLPYDGQELLHVVLFLSYKWWITTQNYINRARINVGEQKYMSNRLPDSYTLIWVMRAYTWPAKWQVEFFFRVY